jgi:hypothetical protein
MEDIADPQDAGRHDGDVGGYQRQLEHLPQRGHISGGGSAITLIMKSGTVTNVAPLVCCWTKVLAGGTASASG